MKAVDELVNDVHHASTMLTEAWGRKLESDRLYSHWKGQFDAAVRALEDRARMAKPKSNDEGK